MGKNLRLAKSFESCYYMYSDSVVVGENRKVCSHKERDNREVKQDDKRGDAAVPEP